MPKKVSFCVAVEWRRVEPDAKHCECCGEVCWLNPVQAFVVVDGKTLDALDIVVCQSCADAGELEITS